MGKNDRGLRKCGREARNWRGQVLTAALGGGAALTRPVLPMAPTVPEDDLHADEAHALDTLLLPPATWTTFPAGNVRSTWQAAAKPASGGLKRGWPDVPVPHDRLHGIALKREGVDDRPPDENRRGPDARCPRRCSR
jgi:hypothetical protein